MSEAKTPSSERGLLSVENLVVATSQGDRVVDDISFSISEAETVALVGESGSGKSLTAKAIAGLLPANLRAAGAVHWDGNELISAGGRARREVRGSQISMLLQDPFTLFNPLSTIGRTMSESVARTSRGPSRRPRDVIEAQILEVGIEPGRALAHYPWELSGGMRQRIGLATAISQRPRLLVADEPTTALDATTQREVLTLIRDLQARRGMALLLITHDLRIASSMADRILVMCRGKIVEERTSSELAKGGQHSYTRKLWAAELPADRRLSDLRVSERNNDHARVDIPPSRSGQTVVLDVRHVKKNFAGNRKKHADSVQALDGVTFKLREGRSMGVIGESGSGKTTLARCILGLEGLTSGEIAIPDGAGSGSVQCVFQDPYSSLNPAHSIRFTLMEAIRHRVEAKSGNPGDEIESILLSVDLDTTFAKRRPTELSGGQRQRVAIARALLLRPRILVCDEPVAALDMTVQAQVLHVLREAQAGGLSMVFITHDVSVARQMTDDLVVLHRGKVVEAGETAKVLDQPQHPYTKKLLASVPTTERDWLDGFN